MDVTEFGEPWLAYKAPFVQRNNGKRHINNYVDWAHFREKQNDVSDNRHNKVYETHNDGKVRSIFVIFLNQIVAVCWKAQSPLKVAELDCRPCIRDTQNDRKYTHRHWLP